VPRAELACGTVGDDGDGMAAQPVRPALRLLWPPAVVLAWRGELFPHMHRGWCSRLGLVSCVLAHTPVGARLVVRGGDLSCEDPSCRELVGDAANWPETGRLTSVGLDQGL
jgi:hypothetical protein